MFCSKVQFSTGIVKNHNKDSQLIDFIKIIIKDLNPSILEANLLLDFYDTVNLTTGEIKTINRNGQKVTPSKNASYKGLEFKIYDTGTITIAGSLHKYWNDGAHNYNDFNIDAILSVLQDLKTKFDIEPEQCVLKCLEIGINIIPSIHTNEIIDNCFLHKTKSFEHKHNSDEGNYKQWEHSQYIVKLYNKALHYIRKGFEIEIEIMRFEIKYIKMQKLNERGIFTIGDLINYGLQNFKSDLLNEWQSILFYDNTIQIDLLSTNLKRAVLEYSNNNYWTGLLANNQTKNFTYHRNQLKKIVSGNSNNVQDLTAEMMSQKIDFLNSKTIQIDPLTIKSKRIVLNYQNEFKNRLCKVTGLNISMQKDNSIMLSHTGINYYYKTDKNIFEQIKRKYLSKRWRTADRETQVIKIAKSIRTISSDQLKQQKRIYQPTQLNVLHIYGI